MSDSPIVQLVPLRTPWPTIDPFLFCVHHRDDYPAGDGNLGPAASLEGRDIGMDFAGIDGWRMYHGARVPGFPQHPHRGFETLTYVRSGWVDHADSLGAVARFGAGDAQWLTAGRGIVHAEMFPLLETDAGNPLELFQIWINLPSHDKLVDPHFTMLWDDQIPRVVFTDDGGHRTVVTVVAGRLGDHRPASPPPHSWASRPDAELAVWHIDLEADGRWSMPPVRRHDVVRALYIVDGDGLALDGHELPAGHGAVVTADREVEVTAPRGRSSALMLQGRPIGEPVAQQGPFVMNTDAEVRQAFADYRATGFGGWPWPEDDPTNGLEPRSFAHIRGESPASPPA